jgi:hypothetical protein
MLFAACSTTSLETVGGQVARFSRHIDEYTHPNWGWILVSLLFSVAGVANLINGYPEHGTEE